MTLRNIFILTFAWIFLPASFGISAAMDAKEIVKKSDDLVRGLQSYSKITMNVERPEWSRTIIMESWTQGTKDAFIRILSPAKEKDTTFLKIGREAWQYIPSIERVMKIPPSMMLQSWMGSDFTNDDLVKTDSMVVDYTHKIIEEPVVDGVKQWKIEMIPKANAAVVWGKVVIFVRQDNFVGVRCEYYNEDMELVKYFITSDIRQVEGKSVPFSFSMIDKKKPGHKTTMTYQELTFKPNMPSDVFTQSNLKRKGR